MTVLLNPYQFAVALDPPEFVAASSVTTSWPSGNFSFTMPAGIQTGDTVFLIAHSWGGDADVIATPSGWTEYVQLRALVSGSSSNPKLIVYACTYDSGSPPSTTFDSTAVGTGVYLVQTVAFRGGDLSGLVTSTSQRATLGTSMTATGVTSTEDNSMIFVAAAEGDDNTIGSRASVNFTIDGSQATNTTTGNTATLHYMYGDMATAGATGDVTWTSSSTSTYGSFAVFALPPG